MLVEWFKVQSPILQALLGTLFTWGVTALGAAGVFFFKQINRRVLDAMLGFTGGVMIAASYWSLLAPAITLAEEIGSMPAWLPPAIGFFLGAVFLRVSDRLIPHLHLNLPRSDAEGPRTSWHRSILLVLAITLHNIPEGLAVGVAFGAVAVGYPGASMATAVALAIGIGIQNFPEGLAVSVPLRREKISRRMCFVYGQFSGMVEPIFGVLGALLVVAMRPILPYALAFAAGAMIYVVIEELIPEAHENKNIDLATMGVIAGFIVMMSLDVALG
ncbi:Metal transporter, ZIP family [Olavius algarvensis spirochete endosymbiont]|uniref:ZIP family metal transporter n=1 Tax=Olavius algarvensis spirochete endosymbiont TaxID=260710 RepID=UPI000F120FF4|nr:ZIP family metal transporter [Olavius algarvensis spirochete endosymbiont]VDB00855.1 Metal transporter, ZIP family [Olavius algarvensis spirochete endosymbiont]